MAWDAKGQPRIEAAVAHACEAGTRLRRETDDARAAEVKEALWGPAVTRIEYAAGRWWAQEYSSAIRFCPWCGRELVS